MAVSAARVLRDQHRQRCARLVVPHGETRLVGPDIVTNPITEKLEAVLSDNLFDLEASIYLADGLVLS